MSEKRQHDFLSCSAVVFRGMRSSAWRDKQTNSVKPEAFLRRPSPSDQGGLSVSAIGAEHACSHLNKHYGACSLLVGRVRDLGLDVLPDEDGHANITGVPYKEDDLAGAERLAGALAKLARYVPVSATPAPPQAAPPAHPPRTA
jgi:hypothetical protein